MFTTTDTQKAFRYDSFGIRKIVYFLKWSFKVMTKFNQEK